MRRALAAAQCPTVPARFRLYHCVLCTSSTSSVACYQTLSGCKNHKYIRNAESGDVVDCSDQSNLAVVTKTPCCLPACCPGGRRTALNHRDGLPCESWTSRRNPLAQVRPLHAGLSLPLPRAPCKAPTRCPFVRTHFTVITRTAVPMGPE